MRLPSRQLVLDTNVLVHLVRNREAGQLLESEYGIRDRRPRAIIPVVVKGEIKSLAIQFGWGGDKLTKVDDLLAQLQRRTSVRMS
jgi:hypothetical protein